MGLQMSGLNGNPLASNLLNPAGDDDAGSGDDGDDDDDGDGDENYADLLHLLNVHIVMMIMTK